MALQAPAELLGIHVNLPGTIPPDIAKAHLCNGLICLTSPFRQSTLLEAPSQKSFEREDDAVSPFLRGVRLC